MSVFHKRKVLDRGSVISRYARREKSVDIQVPGNTNIRGRVREKENQKVGIRFNRYDGESWREVG